MNLSTVTTFWNQFVAWFDEGVFLYAYLHVLDSQELISQVSNSNLTIVYGLITFNMAVRWRSSLANLEKSWVFKYLEEKYGEHFGQRDEK